MGSLKSPRAFGTGSSSLYQNYYYYYFIKSKLKVTKRKVNNGQRLILAVLTYKEVIQRNESRR